MIPADRIVALEAEVERLQACVNFHKCCNPVVMVNTLTGKTFPTHDAGCAYLSQMADMAEVIGQRDAAREEAKGLREALQETAQGLDADGAACWCCIPSMIPYRGHDAGCEAARAALRRAP